MSKHDLQARPIYHHKRNRSTPTSRSFFAAMAITHWIEQQTGWSIKQFVRTARRYRTITIQPENTHRRRPHPRRTSPTPSTKSTAATVRTNLSKLGDIGPKVLFQQGMISGICH